MNKEQDFNITNRPTLNNIWLRVQKAEKDGKGMRLTAEEVRVLAFTVFDQDSRISEGS